jgi:hypothetical protein
MHKLALLTLATASALAPAIASAQTVSPPGRYERTLRAPAAAPAGISWRDRSATPGLAPAARPAPPEADEIDEAGPQVRRFVIRRQPGAMSSGPNEIDIRRALEREDMEGPARVIILRKRRDDSDSHHPDINHHEEMGGHHGDKDSYHRGMGPDHGGSEDEGFDAYGDDDDYGSYHDDRGDFGGSDYPPEYSAEGHAPAQGPCCSGGMITETITTTTTYPPTVERHVVHKQVRVHGPARTYKRKLRRR